MHLTKQDARFLGESIDIMRHMYNVVRDLDISYAEMDAQAVPEIGEFVKRKDKKDTKILTCQDYLVHAKCRCAPNKWA